MAWSLTAHTIVNQAAGSLPITSSNIDTTGASLIAIWIVCYAGAPLPTIVDNKGNSLITIGGQPTSTTRTQLWYIENPTVGTGHNFTVSGASQDLTVFFAAFSGSDTSSPLDQHNESANSGSVTSDQPGSITTTQNGELLITGCGIAPGTGTLVVPSGYTQIDHEAGVGGQTFECAWAYKIQSTAGAENPIWSWTSGSYDGLAIASFKAAAGGAGAKAQIGMIFG